MAKQTKTETAKSKKETTKTVEDFGGTTTVTKKTNKEKPGVYKNEFFSY